MAKARQECEAGPLAVASTLPQGIQLLGGVVLRVGRVVLGFSLTGGLSGRSEVTSPTKVKIILGVAT